MSASQPLPVPVVTPLPVPAAPPSYRTALVHEWIAARAGAEQVFEAIAGAFPTADLYALSQVPGTPLDLQGRRVRTTVLDRPALRDHRGVTLPAMPLAWRALGRRDYDLVITSHHAFATSNRLTTAGVHLAYVHTPARYVWNPELDGRGASPLLAPARSVLAGLDRRAARRLTGVAANSREVARRVQRCWGLDSVVIHPPVDVGRFATAADAPDQLVLPEGYLLALGRFVPYKNHAAVIEVAQRLGRPAVVAGDGPLAARLRAQAAAASVPVLVVSSPTRAQVHELLRRASVLVFPTFEDFGLVPVEAMASGTPVVTLARGGGGETVLDGVSGAHVDDDTPHAYAEAVARAEACAPADCVRRAQDFDLPRFHAELRSWVDSHLGSRAGAVAGL